MNYDFSKMNMSSANAARKEGEEGQPPAGDRPKRVTRPNQREAIPTF